MEKYNKYQLKQMLILCLKVKSHHMQAFTYQIFWIVLNNIFYLSIWAIIYVSSSIVSWKSCEYRGANWSELKR
jgi:hypothetical protein